MRPLRLVPDHTQFRFMDWRGVAFAVTSLVTLISLVSLMLLGLNLGLDFVGGILVEARASRPIELSPLRARFDALQLGEVSLQTSGGKRDLLIRVQEQPGGPAAQERAIAAIKSLLEPGFEIRRTEFIGPQVSRELLRNGILAALLAVLLIGVYVWFRFEWQFGLSAMITTFHDVIATCGLFSLLQLEFNLTVVAALLTIAGYSINDTVVVFDRVRENLRRYKAMPLDELIDLSVNQRPSCCSPLRSPARGWTVGRVVPCCLATAPISSFCYRPICATGSALAKRRRKPRPKTAETMAPNCPGLRGGTRAQLRKIP